jgi:hypothetical protein
MDETITEAWERL